MEKEKVLSQIAEITNFVRDKAAQDSEFVERKSGENKELFERLEKQISGLVESQKKIRDYEDAPLSTAQEETLERGMLNGRLKPSYQRMLSISPNHSLVRSTPEAENIKLLQDLHDAVTFRYQHFNARYGMAAAVDAISKHPDTQLWARELKRHGYISDVAAFLNPKSGQLMDIAMTRNNEVLTTQNTTQGFDNLTFTLVSAQLLDQVYVNLVIAPNLTRIPLTRPLMKFPRLTGLTEGIWGGMNTTGTTGTEVPAQGGSDQVPSVINLMPADAHFQKPTIGSITFAAEHILSYLIFNDDMMDDSIIPWLPFIRSELAKNIARAVDDACMNGDDGSQTGSSPAGCLDIASTDTFAATMAWHGLRWYCLGGAAGSKHTTFSATAVSAITVNGAITLAAIESIIAQMGKYALQPRECVYAVSPADYIRIMTLAQFKEYQLAGASQTFRNGVVGQLYGIDIVPTDIYPGKVNLAGVKEAGVGENQSGGDAYGTSVMWRRDQFLLGMVDTMQVESTRWAPRMFTIAQASIRADMQGIVPGPYTSNTTPGAYPAVAAIKTTW